MMFDGGSSREQSVNALSEASFRLSELRLFVPKEPPLRVLVTGGAGFIGSHVSEALLRLGHRVAILDNFNDYYSVALKRSNVEEVQAVDRELHAPLSEPTLQYVEEPFLQVFEGDMCDETFVTHCFETFQPTHVIHLAARAGVRPSIVEPLLYVRTNLEATTLLMELSARYHVSHFLFASSSSVYGESMADSFQESDLTDTPLSPYGATKKACELMAATYAHLYHLPCTGFRFFTVYGPRGRPDMAPFKFMHRIMQQIPIQRYGDGSTERDYTYVGDIVNGILLAMDHPPSFSPPSPSQAEMNVQGTHQHQEEKKEEEVTQSKGFRVFNLGCGRPVRLSYFISTLESVLDTKAIIEELPPQPGDVPRTSASIALAKRVLNFEPQVSVEEGLRRTAEWYKKKIIQEQIPV
jgi:UDP-glucuronate 4-epimerase